MVLILHRAYHVTLTNLPNADDQHVWFKAEEETAHVKQTFA